MIMASLNFFIKKHGAKKGRKLYNEYHREYWARNHDRLVIYYRDYRKRGKVSNSSPSGAHSLSPAPPLS